jgi:hypothetical protein
LPQAVVKPLLPFLNTTATEDGNRYWHIVLEPDESGRLNLVIPKKGDRMALGPYEVQLIGAVRKE